MQLQYDEADPRPISLDLQVEQTSVVCTFYSPAAVEAVSSQYVPTVEPAWPTPLPPHLLEALTAPPEPIQADEPRRVWRVVPAADRPRAPAWVIGNLVHAALALWRFPDDTYTAWAEAQARNLGLTDPRQLINAAIESRRLLERFQTHPLYQTITRAEQRLHEVPYSLALDGQADSGVIDLLYQQAGHWTLVEFKSDRVKDEAHRQAILQQSGYLAQVDRYRRAVWQLLEQDPQVILCWLNFEGRVEAQADLIEVKTG
jgi:ATP-dependent exoDNAse (exonuclease V) beta subunit